MLKEHRLSIMAVLLDFKFSLDDSGVNLKEMNLSVQVKDCIHQLAVLASWWVSKVKIY